MTSCLPSRRIIRFHGVSLLLLWALAALSRTAHAEDPSTAPPAPLLGPGGLLWLGPLPPDPLHSPLTLVANPRDGHLWLSMVDATLQGDPDPLVLGRIWTGEVWEWYGLDAIIEEEDGITVRRPGAPSLFFVGDEALPKGVPWPSGAMLQHPEGCQLQVIESGYRLHFPDGRWEEFDDDGHLRLRSRASGGEIHYQWADGSLSAIAAADGRSFTLSSLEMDASRVVQIATASGGQRVRFEDEDGRLAAVTAPDGSRSRYYYDEEGRLHSLVRDDGSTVTLDWDDEQRIVGIDGPGAQRRRFTWGQDGIRSMEDPLGTWTFHWAADSLRVDHNSGQSTTLLLEEGRIAGWVDPAGSETRIFRAENGQVNGLVDARGTHWRLGLDPLGALHEITDSLADAWRYDHDLMGRLVGLLAPDGRRIRWERDGQGLVHEVVAGRSRTRFIRDRAGRVEEIISTGLMSTRLVWNKAGHLLSIQDPTGGTTTFADHRRGVPGTVTGPSQEQWKISFDALGRPDGIRTQGEAPISWRRDASGILKELRRGSLVTHLDIQPDGRISRILDPLGGTTGWAWSALGRLSSWRQPDGSRLLFTRDARGELTGIGYGDYRVEMRRDSLGRLLGVQVPQGAQDLEMRRDNRGLIGRLTWPTGTLVLDRNASGLVRKVGLDGRTFTLSHDSGGRLSQVNEGSSVWIVERDGDGRVLGMVSPSGAWRLRRNPRGLPIGLEMLATTDSDSVELQWNRDASGRILAVHGPGDSVIGLTRDENQQLALVRFTGGSLIWVERMGELLNLRYEGSTNVPLLNLAITRDALGRVVQQDDGISRRFRYDPVGRLASVETDEGAWSSYPGRVDGPDGEGVTLDAAGRPTSATPSAGPSAWGIGIGKLDYGLDAQGVFRTLTGDRGDAVLVHDALGRLLEVRILPQTEATAQVSPIVYRLGYGPFGDLTSVEGPGGKVVPSTVEGRIRVFTGDEERVTCLDGPLGKVLVGGRGMTLLATDPHGTPVLAMVADRPPLRIHTTPTGFPDAIEPPPWGAGGRLQLFPGGPLIGPSEALDPVSGQATGRPPIQWPWVPTPWNVGQGERWPVLDGGTPSTWDPAWWDPETLWSSPLDLLVALQVIPAPDPGQWWSRASEEAPLPWLPASMQGGDPPLGPGWSDLPVDLDPVSALFVASAAFGAEQVTTEAILTTLLRTDLTKMPFLLPGLPWPQGLPTRLHTRDLPTGEPHVY